MTEKYIVEYRKGCIITSMGNVVEVLIKDNELYVFEDYKNIGSCESLDLDSIDSITIRKQI